MKHDGAASFIVGCILGIFSVCILVEVRGQIHPHTVSSCTPAYVITTEGHTYLSDVPVATGSTIKSDEYREITLHKNQR